MSLFTPAAAGALAGPEWLRRRRTAAADRLAALSLPTSAEEIWRYSRIGKLDLDAYRLAEPLAAGVDPRQSQTAELYRDLVPSVVTLNGQIVHNSLAESLVGSAETLLGKVLAEGGDYFTDANDAFLADPVVIRVPRGRSVEEPIVVVHVVDSDGAAVFPRLVLDAEDASSVTLAEVFLSPGVSALVVPLSEIRVGRDARVTHVTLQDTGPQVWRIARLVGRVDAQASLDAHVAAFGGAYSRLRIDCELAGRGATGRLAAVYFGEGSQMHDFRTFQDHQAPDTTSDLLFKGVLDDSSHSVYTGLIRVRPAARGTNALQTNRNIKLSPDAWAESVPNLEIENNDVRCSHASAVGPIDEEQRFYLESRGVPPTVADRLIVSGFLDEVIERIPVDALRDRARATVAAKLVQRADVP